MTVRDSSSLARRSVRLLLAGVAICATNVAMISSAEAQISVTYGSGANNTTPIVIPPGLFPPFLPGTAQLDVPTGAAEQSGVITAAPGDGAVFKVGAGSLLLSAANAYSLGTFIQQGTLIAGNSQAFGTGPIQFQASATVGYRDGVTIANPIGIVNPAPTIATLDVASGRATQAGDIVGPFGNSTIVKTGAGALVLTGNNGFISTTINGGTLIVDGTITNSPLTTVNASGTLIVNGTIDSPLTTVNAGGTIGGIGTVGNLAVAGGGTVAPGNSIGVLNVAGNVNFAAGSIYQVEVNAAGQSDRIAATGTATLNGGTVQVLPAPGSYAAQTVYTILTAPGGVTGNFANLTATFAGVNPNSIFLGASLSYPGQSVLLTITRSPFAGVAATPNQVAVANALDLGGGALALALLNQTTAAGARQAFDALSGEVHASVPSVLLEDSRYVRQGVLGRLRQATAADATGAAAALAAGGPALAYQATPAKRSPIKAYPVKAPLAPAPVVGPDLTAWVHGFGAWGKIDGDGNAATVNRTLGGFLTGIDTGIAGAWRLGVATGYTQSNMRIDARGSAADIESTHLAGYAGTQLGPFALRAGAAYSWHSIDTSRSIIFPGFFERVTSRYDGSTTQVFGEVGHGMTFGSLALEPFAGLAWVHVDTDRVTEVGGTAALTGEAAGQRVGYSTLGLRAATSLSLGGGMALVPRASLAWQHAFSDVTPTAALAFQSTGVPFGIAGVPIARDSTLVEAGADLRVHQRVTVGVSYLGQLADSVTDHAVKGKLGWTF